MSGHMGWKVEIFVTSWMKLLFGTFFPVTLLKLLLQGCLMPLLGPRMYGVAWRSGPPSASNQAHSSVEFCTDQVLAYPEH